MQAELSLRCPLVSWSTPQGRRPWRGVPGRHHAHLFSPPPNITGNAGGKSWYASMHAHTGTCPRAVIETARSHNSTFFCFPLLLSSLARPPEGFENLLAHPHGNMSPRCHRNCAESYFNVFWCFVTPRVRRPTWAPGT